MLCLEQMRVAAATAMVTARAGEEGEASRGFTERRLREALTINSPNLVRELYEITLRRIVYETGRQQRLDSKATSLLTASGVSVTLAFTFTAVITSEAGGKIFHPIFNYLLGAFGAALAFGIAAAFIAVGALKIRKGYPGAADEVVFDRDGLQSANRIEPDTGQGETEADAEGWRLMVYQKGLIEHFWTIANRQEAIHESKAKWVRNGQWAFFGFMAFIVVACCIVGFAAYSDHHGAETSAGPAATSAGAS